MGLKQKAPGSVAVFPPQALFVLNLLLTHSYKVAGVYGYGKYFVWQFWEWHMGLMQEVADSGE